MKNVLMPLLALLLCAASAVPLHGESSPRDPIAPLLEKVVAAIELDDFTAFDPLVPDVTAFNWDAALGLVTNYQCPTVERWSFTVLEQSDDAVRVTLDLQATAVLAGRGLPARLHRFWVLDLQKVRGRWLMRSFTTLERDLARRILRARPDEREALFLSDANADPHLLIRELGDASLFEMNAAVREREGPKADCLTPSLALIRFTLDEARRVGTASDRAIALARCASTLRFYGLRAESLAMSEEALGEAYDSDDPDAMASALFARGLGRWVNGDVKDAREDLYASARLAHFVDDVLPPLHAMSMYVHLDEVDRDYGMSLMHSDELSSLSHEIGWTEGECYAAWVVADVHGALRDFSAARDGYAQVYATALRNHMTFANLALADMARADFALGHFARAEEEIRQSKQNIGARNLAGFATILMAEGKLAEAESAVRDAVAAGKDEDDTIAGSEAYTVLAELRLRQHHPAAALDAARQALRRGMSGKAPLVDWSPWPAEAVAARALRDLGREREARATIENAVGLIEQLRTGAASDPASVRYFENKAELYDELMETNLALGDTRGALAATERLRARTLRDSLSQAAVDRNASLTAAERAREDAAEQALEAVNRKILGGERTTEGLRAERDRCRRALDRITDELMTRHPELHVRRADFRPSLSLPPSLASTAVLEYAVTARATYVFTVLRKGTRTTITVQRVAVTRAQLSRLVDRLTKQIAQRDFNYRETALRLHNLLLRPAAELFVPGKELCIIPDGPLWRLPFQVLTDRSGTDLLSRMPTFYAPSLTLLTTSLPAQHSPGGRTLVAFANPVAGRKAAVQMRNLYGGSFGALPDAETEVRRIAAIYGRVHSEIFVGNDARESTFKREARSARIVHVATHGVIDDQAPLYSALLLAPGGEGHDDGLLEAHEVLDLHLDTDLVVLSACDTARGKIGAGEGVVGLSWAFLVAGCRTLVVAQSPAESRATAQLMVEFHRQLATGLSPAEALQRAEIALRRNPRFRHPFYWAPFVVIGHGFAPLAK